MDNVKLLDCTLRDGGRIIDCNFGEQAIINICKNLQLASINYIEVGFIRNKISYKRGSTFFTDINQIEPYITAGSPSKYVLFVDHNMYDINQFDCPNNNLIWGIRLGFKKGALKECYNNILNIKERGYKVFLQDINTLGYSDNEIKEMIKIVNELKPYSLAIVDTYGAMYSDDIRRYIHMFNECLSPGIAIDFHSHNNYQLSFSLAQNVIELANENYDREFIIDSTLYGMGKVAGNLNTELIAEYLVRKYAMPYDTSVIFDCIDETIIPIYEKSFWGYSTNALLSGKYQSHPNNVIYLTEKFKLDTNDIENILSMIDDDKRKIYDYANIERCYIEYYKEKKNMNSDKKILKQIFSGKPVLLLAPGTSISSNWDNILKFSENMRLQCVSVNYICQMKSDSFAFFANQKRYKQYDVLQEDVQIILSSNIKKRTGKELMIDYNSIICGGWKNFDNAMIMMLRFLSELNVEKIYIAGFDGFQDIECNFIDSRMMRRHSKEYYENLNADILEMFRDIRKKLHNTGVDIEFLTTSIFDV